MKGRQFDVKWRERERQTDRQRHRERERDRQTDKDTERERDFKREFLLGNVNTIFLEHLNILLKRHGMGLPFSLVSISSDTVWTEETNSTKSSEASKLSQEKNLQKIVL